MSRSQPRTVVVTLASRLASLASVAIMTCTVLAQTEPTVVPPPTPHASGVIGTSVAGVTALGGMLSNCKACLCNSALGRLLNGAMKPIEFVTGGVIPSPCPGPNQPANKSKNSGANSSASAGPPGPQQAAEAIKQDQAQAKTRRDAVRYLATVPCHYYPEAEAALIKALRTDRSECVRWEAAHALAQGCCCSKRTIEALNLAASGSQKDGNPSELSMRVRIEAINALQYSLALCGASTRAPQRPETPTGSPETIKTPTPTPSPAPKRPELPAEKEPAVPQPAKVQQAGYYAEVEEHSMQELLAESRRLIDSYQLTRAASLALPPRKSLVELWQRASASHDGDPVRRSVQDDQ